MEISLSIKTSLGFSTTITAIAAVINPTVLPTIIRTTETTIIIAEGGSFTNPLWTWEDDISQDNPVVWSGDTVDPATPGIYKLTATATNLVGEVSQDIIVFVKANVVELPGFVPRWLECSPHKTTLFTGRGNWLHTQILYNGAGLDLTQFVRFKLSGLTEEPLDSLYGEYFRSDDEGNFYINGELVPTDTLVKPVGQSYLTLVGYTTSEPHGVVLIHPSMDAAFLTVEIIPTN